MLVLAVSPKYSPLYIIHKVLKNCVKCFLFYQKSLFCFPDFFPEIFILSQSSVCLEFHHVSKLELKNPKLLNILKSKEDLILKLGHLIKYHVREVLVQKVAENIH